MDVAELDSLRIALDPIGQIGVCVAMMLVILVGQLQGLRGAAVIAAVWGVRDLLAGGSIAVFSRFVDRRRTSDHDAETAA